MDLPPGGIDALLGQYPPEHPIVIEAMVQSYRAPLYRLALSILGQAGDAEDAVQETFIHAARGLPGYRPGTNFRAWIFRIAVNVCRSMLRKRTRGLSLQQALSSILALAGRPPLPEEQAVLDETHAQLWRMVARLPEAQRLVVLLHLAHDLTVAEVAQVLGTHQKTVYSRLYAAYRSLRLELERGGRSSLLTDE